MKQYIGPLNIFVLLRSRLLGPWLRGRATLYIIDKSKGDWATTIPVILGELAVSKSPSYSDYLLALLLAVPPETLDGNESLRKYFIWPQLKAQSVSEAIGICRAAIKLCFLA